MSLPDIILNSLGTAAALGGLSLLFNPEKQMTSLKPPPLPEIPGLPVVGNLLQLKEKKPHKTFTKWAETYGPIYSIKTGSTTMIVLNSDEVAKEAMVTRFQSILTRKMSNALNILTMDKTMVAMSDYDEFHKTVKRHLLTSVLGPNAQKKHSHHRDILVENTSTNLHSHFKNYPLQAANLRDIFESELFGLALKQALGKDVESIYVDDLGITLTRKEIFKVLVLDPMDGALEVDWRDFFPNLKWVPNKNFEDRLQRMHTGRDAVMKALFRENRTRTESGEEADSYIDYLLSEAKTLTAKQMRMLVWETIIETADTTLISTEWAMYELAKNPERQKRLFHEIQSVFGSEKI